MTRDAGIWVAVVVVLSIPLGGRMARTAGIPSCTGAQSTDARCFRARYAALTRAGVTVALEDLSQRSKTSEYLAAACHQLTHVIGRTAGELRGKAAFTEGSNQCASGFYHGVTEAVMMSIGRDHILHRAQKVCAEHREASPRSFDHYNCVHGMGHGFMAVFDSDVFKALPACDLLPDEWERHHCYGGVFMENLTAADNASRPSKHLRRDAPLYPCTVVEKQYASECYVEQTAYALSARNDDFGAVFRLCRDEAGPDVRTACYEGLGGDAAIKASKVVIGVANQLDTIHDLCLQAPDDEARSHCLIGAVTTLETDTSGQDDRARALCEVLEDSRSAALCESARIATIRGFARKDAHHH